MVIELTGILGGAVALVLAGLLLPRVRGRMVEPEMVTMMPENTSWRLLESDEGVREALARAIACEQASIKLSEQRSRHFAALQTQLDPTIASPHPSRKPRQSRPRRVPSEHRTPLASWRLPA